MPDKTPLELAREIAATPDGELCATYDARAVAAALVERMTPVEIDLIEPMDGFWTGRSGLCRCGQMIKWPDLATSPKFCHACGKPLVWK